MDIEVHKADDGHFGFLDIKSWPIWEKDVGEFDWSYTEKETCLILEGKAEVTAYGETISFKKGDIVVFPAGLSCKWNIIEKIVKHYKMG